MVFLLNDSKSPLICALSCRSKSWWLSFSYLEIHSLLLVWRDLSSNFWMYFVNSPILVVTPQPLVLLIETRRTVMFIDSLMQCEYDVSLLIFWRAILLSLCYIQFTYLLTYLFFETSVSKRQPISLAKAIFSILNWELIIKQHFTVREKRVILMRF